MGSSLSIENEFIKKLTEITEANLTNEQFGVTELAREMGISRTVLYRKVKLKTKKSVSKFISEIRLEKAVELLKQQSGNVSEVAYLVGFGSPSYFIKCFHDHFGYSPGEILNGNSPENLNQSDSEKTRKRRMKVRSAIVLTTVVATLILFLIYQNNHKTKPDKTIAVLSFVNESPNESLTIINGLREKLFTNLELIEDIKLVARKTSGKYTGENYRINEIGKKLNANYILKGSSVTINGTTRIWLYLIEAESGKTLLSRPYQNEISIDNFFEIQNEIATLITEKLDAVFTSEEKNEIAKIPTQNSAAFNLYLQGLYKQKLYELDNKKENYLEAKLLYERAIKRDSIFADAYCNLADIYISNLAVEHFSDSYIKNLYLFNLYLDSGMVLVNKAMNLENCEIDKALQLKVDYHQRKGEHNEALKYFEQLWENKNKDYNYYLVKSRFYHIKDDYYNTIENMLLYLKLKPEHIPADILRMICLRQHLGSAGFPEVAKHYAEEILALNDDSIMFLNQLSIIYFRIGNFDADLKILFKLYYQDTTSIKYLNRIYTTYFHQNNYPMALKYAKLFDTMHIKQYGEIKGTSFKAYLYRINGMEKEAELNIKKSFERCKYLIQANNAYAQNKWANGSLSMLYAMEGDKERALKELRIMIDRETFSLSNIIQLKVLPVWDNIRNEPEYQEMLKEAEGKYQKEHDKVEKLLIHEGIIQ